MVGRLCSSGMDQAPVEGLLLLKNIEPILVVGSAHFWSIFYHMWAVMPAYLLPVFILALVAMSSVLCSVTLDYMYVVYILT